MKKRPSKKQIAQFKAQRKKDIRYLLESIEWYLDFDQRKEVAVCLDRIHRAWRLAVEGPGAL